MTFEKLQIEPSILDALKQGGYSKPTSIQAQAIPVVLSGRDLIGCAQTGTGKTGAFAIPIIQILQKHPKKLLGPIKIRALILTPTRELAVQVGEMFSAYGKYTKLRHCVVYGGVNQYPQTKALRTGVDILVATPGRLMDLINQGYVNLANVEIFTLDEADRMLDMGFIHDVKKIIKKIPQKRQTLFFSATMSQEIVSLSNTILTNPIKVKVDSLHPTADNVKQELYYVDRSNKKSLLMHLLQGKTVTSALVFTRTKHGADKVVKLINTFGHNAEAIHGNKSQNARQKALNNFKNNKTRILVATDIASRGIDINNLSHVINYDIPNEPETYVHRIGRTGRAGASGIALSFCDNEEQSYVRSINRFIKNDIPVIEDHPFPMKITPSNSFGLKNRNKSKGNRVWFERRKRRRPIGSGSR